LNEDFINANDFLVADIRVDGERHFLLANKYQLRLLREAKRWYMDGIFKANHYVVFITPSNKHGYNFQVLSEPFRQQGQFMCIRAFIERNGAQKQLPLLHGVELKGCAFHWFQAIWRHVQPIGLVETHTRQEGLLSFVRQVLVLLWKAAGTQQ
ncbi:hypothetical protein CHS0354_038006, partial [Potamilus streckersoni]